MRWKAIVFFVVGALMIAGVAFGISTVGHEDANVDGDGVSTSPSGAEVQQYPPVPERVRTTGRYAIATTFGADPDADLPVSMVVPAGYRGVSGLAALQPGGETGVIIMAVGSVYAAVNGRERSSTRSRSLPPTAWRQLSPDRRGSA